MTDIGEAFRKAGYKSPADWLDQAMDEAGDKANWLRDPSSYAFKAILLDEADDRALAIWELCREVRETAILQLFKRRLFKRQESKETAHRAKKSTGAAGLIRSDTQVPVAHPPVETLQHSSPSDGNHSSYDTQEDGVPGSAVESQPSPPAKGDHGSVDTQHSNVSGSVADHISEPSDGGQVIHDTPSDIAPSPAQGANKLPTKPHIPPSGGIPSMARLGVSEKLAAEKRWRALQGRLIGEYTDEDLAKLEKTTEHEAKFINLLRAALLQRAPGEPPNKRRVSKYLEPWETDLLDETARASKAA
jgi:hypothetical protein